MTQAEKSIRKTPRLRRVIFMTATLTVLVTGHSPQAADKDSATMKEKLDALLRKSPEADANKDGVLTMEEAKALSRNARTQEFEGVLKAPWPNSNTTETK